MISYSAISRIVICLLLFFGVIGCASVDTESRIGQLNNDVSDLVEGDLNVELEASSAEHLAKVPDKQLPV